VDARVFAAFRIALALFFVLDLVLSAGYVELWWSDAGVLPIVYRRLFAPDPSLSIFDWLPHTTSAVWWCWSIALVQGLLLLLGLGTRFQTLSVLLWATSFDYRNGMILDGGDKILRLLIFFLLFAPAAEVLSVDAVLRRRRGGAPLLHVDGWPLRLIQMQMCIMLWSAGFEKLDGALWRDGSAMYYILNLDDFALHGPIPNVFRTSLVVSQLSTWGSLLVELGGPLLIWFQETRRAALFAIVLLHLAIEYTMSIYMFEWIVLLGWMSHASLADVQWLRALPRRIGFAWERRARVNQQDTNSAASYQGVVRR
jgi:hypothetical protein